MHKSNGFSQTDMTTFWLTGFLTGDSPCSTTAESGSWATASWASSSSSSSLWATMLWSGPFIWRSSWWVLRVVCRVVSFANQIKQPDHKCGLTWLCFSQDDLLSKKKREKKKKQSKLAEEPKATGQEKNEKWADYWCIKGNVLIHHQSLFEKPNPGTVPRAGI